MSPVHNNAAVRKKVGAPTTQEEQRGGVLGQQTPLRCDPEAGAPTELSENIPDFLPKLSANLP